MIKIVETSLKEEAVGKLQEYVTVPSRFTISRIFEVIPSHCGLEGIRFIEKELIDATEKDYDSIEPPLKWADLWDLSNWVMLTAHIDARPVGGCIVAWNTEGVNILEDRSDLSALWDIRVSPDFKRKGIGSQLFDRAIEWSQARGCKMMNIETQNNNVSACHFYAQKGCELRSINRFHYPDFPEEVQLIWQKTI
jgi:ribosomal protein S18 acetylase RimI-like enzyme